MQDTTAYGPSDMVGAKEVTLLVKAVDLSQQHPFTPNTSDSFVFIILAFILVFFVSQITIPN